MDLCDRVMLVFENVVPTLQGAVQLLRLLNNLGFPQHRHRVILNRYTTLPGSLRPADVAARLGHNVDYVFPYDKQVIIAANMGEPFVLRAGRFSTLGRQLRAFVDDVEAITQEEPPRDAVPAVRRKHSPRATVSGRVARASRQCLGRPIVPTTRRRRNDRAGTNAACRWRPASAWIRAHLAATPAEYQFHAAGARVQAAVKPPSTRVVAPREVERRRSRPATSSIWRSKGPCTNGCWTSWTGEICSAAAKRRSPSSWRPSSRKRSSAGALPLNDAERRRLVEDLLEETLGRGPAGAAAGRPGRERCSRQPARPGVHRAFRPAWRKPTSAFATPTTWCESSSGSPPASAGGSMKARRWSMLGFPTAAGERHAAAGDARFAHAFHSPLRPPSSAADRPGATGNVLAGHERVAATPWSRGGRIC